MDFNTSNILNKSINSTEETFSESPIHESLGITLTTLPSFRNYSSHDFPSTTDELITADVHNNSKLDPPTIEQEMDFMETSIQNYYEFPDEQYSTPFLIIFLNFFLCSFLMIVIGIAVYPAVKKYCDTSFPSSNSSNLSQNIHWIEDTDEVVTANIATGNMNPNYGDSSFALLNIESPAPRENSLGDTCDFELIAEVNISA